MAQTPITQGNQAGAHIVDEPSQKISRKTVVITGGNYPAGTVLGKITASGKYTEHTPGAGDGSENAAAILFDNVDASTADQNGVVSTCLTAVNAAEVVWKSGISQGNQDAAIVALEAKFFAFL